MKTKFPHNNSVMNSTADITNISKPNTNTNNTESINIYLFELEKNNSYISKNLEKFKYKFKRTLLYNQIPQIHNIRPQLKLFNDKPHYENKLLNNLNEITDILDNIIIKDIGYNNFIAQQEKINQRINTTFISKEINFCINHEKYKLSIYEDEIFKLEVKNICKQINQNLPSRQKNKIKNRIVKEYDYSFSDDSIECLLIPDICFDKNGKKFDNIIGKSDTRTKLENNLKKEKSLGKVKTKLTNDIKSILLLTKYLNIN